MLGENIDKLKADTARLAQQSFESGALAMKLEVVKLLSRLGYSATVVAVADLPLPKPPKAFGALADG